MPWLADLVESSEGSLSVLPAQCLCEFLLMKDGQWKKERKDGSSLDKKVATLSIFFFWGGKAKISKSVVYCSTKH